MTPAGAQAIDRDDAGDRGEVVDELAAGLGGGLAVARGGGVEQRVGGAVGETTLHLAVNAALGPDVTVKRAAGVDINTDQTANLTTTGLDIAVGVAAALTSG